MQAVIVPASVIERAREHDQSAFGAIYEAYHAEIYRYLWLQMGSNEEDAADLAQDTFVKAFKAIRRTKPGLKVRPWLWAIALNVLRDRKRRDKLIRFFRWQTWLPPNDWRHGGSRPRERGPRMLTTPRRLRVATAIPDQSEYDETAPEAQVGLIEDQTPEVKVLAADERGRQGAEVRVVLRTLAPPYQQALYLIEWCQMSYDDTAIAMGKSYKGVKSTIYRARREFRVAWIAQGNLPDAV